MGLSISFSTRSEAEAQSLSVSVPDARVQSSSGLDGTIIVVALAPVVGEVIGKLIDYLRSSKGNIESVKISISDAGVDIRGVEPEKAIEILKKVRSELDGPEE